MKIQRKRTFSQPRNGSRTVCIETTSLNHCPFRWFEQRDHVVETGVAAAVVIVPRGVLGHGVGVEILEERDDVTEAHDTVPVDVLVRPVAIEVSGGSHSAQTGASSASPVTFTVSSYSLGPLPK